MAALDVLMQALAVSRAAKAPNADPRVREEGADFRALLLDRYQSRVPGLARMLDLYDQAPEQQAANLEAALRDCGADQNPELIQQATDLVRGRRGWQRFPGGVAIGGDLSGETVVMPPAPAASPEIEGDLRVDAGLPGDPTTDAPPPRPRPRPSSQA